MNKKDYEKVAEYCANRVSIREIMLKLKIKRSYVYKLAKAANISFVGGYISREEFMNLKDNYLYQKLDKVKTDLKLFKNNGLTQLPI